jgi:hypothetical protein
MRVCARGILSLPPDLERRGEVVMSNQPDPGEESAKPAGDPQTFSREVHHSGATARVPEKVARGAFSTGVLIIEGPSEFVLDFVQRMNQPHQVVARVVVPFGFLPRLVGALRDNLETCRKTFGALPSPPASLPATPPPSAEEIYGSLKMSDDVVVGAYANAAFVSHSQSIFSLDFIASFYPRATVSARVYLGTAQVPGVISSLGQAWQTRQTRLQSGGQPKPPEE